MRIKQGSLKAVQKNVDEKMSMQLTDYRCKGGR